MQSAACVAETCQAAIAEFERDLIAERTRDGLAPARQRHGGKLPPRGPSISPDKLAVARQLYKQGDMPARRIAEVVDISRASLYRALPPGGRRATERSAHGSSQHPQSGSDG